MSPTHHAFLILAHEDELMLSRLVTRMSELGEVFVHIDAKTDISAWDIGGLDCIFLSKRIPVYWGDWSMVEATLLLLEAALAVTSMTRFTLLSGSHYPIISNTELRRRSKNSTNVIASRPAPNMPDGSRPESEFCRRFYRTRKPVGFWARVKNGFMNHVVFYRRPLDWKAVAPLSGMRAGQPYWSIERDFAEYCVSQLQPPSALNSYFRKIVCSDEKTFATLYGEYAQGTSPEGTTFAKWQGGPHPTKITQDDIIEARQKGQFWFARKFSSNDAEILDWLDNH